MGGQEAIKATMTSFLLCLLPAYSLLPSTSPLYYPFFFFASLYYNLEGLASDPFYVFCARQHNLGAK